MNTWISGALGALSGGLVQTEGMQSSLEETAKKGSPNVTASDFAAALQQYQQTGNAQVLADYLSSQGDNWSQLVNANPWAQQQYHQSKFQKFMSKLGFRTGYDTFLESQQMGSNQYLADLMQQFYQQEFNKPSSQVEQMRAAGQNPDLLGTGDVQSAPGALTDNDAIPTEAFQADEVQTLAGFAQQITGLTDLVSGCIGQVFQMSNMAADLRSKHIANGEGLLQMAHQLIDDFSPVDLGFSDDDSAGWSDILHDSIDASMKRNIARNVAAKKLGLRNKDVSRVVDLMTEMIPMLGGQTRIHEGQLKFADVKGKNLLAQGDMFQNPMGISTRDQFNFIKPFAKMQEDMTKAYFEIQKKMQNLQNKQINVQSRQADNQMIFENVYNPTSAAEATNVSNDLAKLKAEFSKSMQEAQNGMLQSVQRNAQKGDKLSKVLWFLLISTGFVASSGVGQVLTGAANGIGAIAKGFNPPITNNNSFTTHNFYNQ